MARPSLLFLSHRIPFPPNKGDKIRSYHLLRSLADRYDVHAGTFVDDEDDWRHLPELETLCADVCAVRLNPHRQRLWSARGLLLGQALSLPYYRNRKLQSWVERKVREEDITRIVAFSSPMAQYLPGNGSKARSIVDFVDVDSEKWRQYSERRGWPTSWLYRREGNRLLDFERRVAASVDASFFVTPEEAELFRRRVNGLRRPIESVVNGVDTEYFDPGRRYDNPFASRGAVIVFTGVMDYWANVDAVTWFAREVFPVVRDHFRDARLYIVGARPTREVRRLAGGAGVEVTGAVADVRPYLAHAWMAVAPMRIGRGIQNKVLEALAMARPVVATRAASEGLALPDELRRYVGDDAKEMARTVIGLLHSTRAREQAGRIGRAWVERHHDWKETFKRLVDWIEGTDGSR